MPPDGMINPYRLAGAPGHLTALSGHQHRCGPGVFGDFGVSVPQTGIGVVLGLNVHDHLSSRPDRPIPATGPPVPITEATHARVGIMPRGGITALMAQAMGLRPIDPR